jgi:hypothetical protein
MRFSLVRTECAPEFFWQLGAGLLVNVAAAFAITAMYFVIGGQLGPVSAPILLTISYMAALGAMRLYSADNLVVAALGLFAIQIVSIVFAGVLYDTTIDGQDYHFQAIHSLIRGWNPFRQGFEVPDDLQPIALHPWVVFFPKSTWFVSAIQVASGLSVESAKNQGLLLMVASFFALLGLLLKLGYAPIASLALSLCASANPVATNQVFSRMTDGPLSASLLLFGVFAVLWVKLEDRRAWIGMAAALAYGVNLKFSAVPMFAVACAFVCLAYYRRGDLSRVLATGGVLATVGIVSIVVLGYAPYMSNWLEHGHIFHPLMGAQRVDIMEAETLRALSPLHRFIFALFAETHSGFATEMRLKVPFFFSWEEFRYAGGPDIRIAGFGPFFSGAVVIALGVAVTLSLYKWRDRRVRWAALVLAAIVTSAAILPENWWARYVPQLWLVPAVVAAAALALKAPVLVVAGWCIVLTMLINSAVAFSSNVWLTAKRHQVVNAQIAQLLQENERYCVYFGAAQSRLALFRRAGLDVRPVARQNSCANATGLASYGPDRQGGEVCRCAHVR